MLRSIFATVILFFVFSLSISAQVNPNSILPAKLKGTITLKAPAGVAGQANGIKSGAIVAGVDTSIRVNPKMAYISIDFTALTGATQMEILSGKESYWIFDKAGKQVALTEKVLHSVKAAMENTTVCDMKVRVPYRLKTDKNLYTVHYKWESPDKSKNIDILTTK